MENVKNVMELHITTDDKNAIKWVSKSTYKNCNEIFGLYMIDMFKSELILDKPMYVGTSILDLSKLHMMDFHYIVIESNFHGNYNLLYSDTDSFVYHTYTKDLYEWISENKHYFDLSDSEIEDLKDNKHFF